MARRRGLMASLAQMQREAERAQAARNRAVAQSQREAERTRLAYQRSLVADERERKRLYAESRTLDVAVDNAALQERVAELQGLLGAGLGARHGVDLEALKPQLRLPVFDAGVGGPVRPAPVLAAFLPPAPSGVGRLLGGAARHEEQTRRAHEQYQRAVAEHAQWAAWREQELGRARAQHDAEVERRTREHREQTAQVEAFQRAWGAGEPDAIVSYLDMALNASVYPEAFPRGRRLAYVPESRQLVVEYELPTLDVVPLVKAYRYVKTSDSVTETARPQAQVRALYASVVAQTALRVLHEVFQADRFGHVGTVVLNAMVNTTDPRTGQPVSPCLLTVRTTRDTFAELDLAHVEPEACLRHLGAGVSRSPAELSPVRPVLEFDMVDPRFVAEDDIIGGLDQRPNLLEMTPTEFEGLIQNLFTRMGLEARQTRASRDGGVDCVAYDPRPIMGGKVVIQAKRYRNTVGVSAVRDLFGTLQNEGASKGILVTTSGYGQASYDFAKNKPIELLDGANLLFLLQEHAGIEARIEAPAEWRDPTPDSPPAEDRDERPSPPPPQPPTAGPPPMQGQAPAAVDLIAGQNVPVNGAQLTARLTRSNQRDADLSVLLLGADGRVGVDEDFIFYNNPATADGAVQLRGGASPDECILDLTRLPDHIHRVVMVTSNDLPFDTTTAPQLTVTGADGPIGFRPTELPAVTGVLLAEIYRRDAAWRLRAIGQGYADGLAGLARDFGVNLE